jgi:hypothetical protein
LEDYALSQYDYLVDCFGGIAQRVFQNFATSIFDRLFSIDDSALILQREVSLLLMKFCSRSTLARVLAEKSITFLIDKFPQVRAARWRWKGKGNEVR